MSLSKQFLPEPTSQVYPPRTRDGFYHRVTALLPAIVMRRRALTYLLSRAVQMAIDAGIAIISFTLAHILRFDGWPPGIDDDRMLLALPYLVLARLSVNYLMGMYSRVWRYVSIPDAAHLSC